jgi:hypothetical protein
MRKSYFGEDLKEERERAMGKTFSKCNGQWSILERNVPDWFLGAARRPQVRKRVSNGDGVDEVRASSHTQGYRLL